MSPRERHHMVFVDKWSSFEGYILLFNQGRATEMLPLFKGGLNSEAAFNTCLTVHYPTKCNI